MRLNLFCGEAFTQEMAQQWSDCLPNARIENVYGPTEATIWCTAYPWNEQQSSAEAFNGIVSIGRPVPGSGAVVVDESGMVCAAGEKGELVLSGPQVMDGYWKDTKKTGEVMIEVSVEGQREKAYRSGDIAFVNEYGNLIYCGRLDSQVKIDGHRVELGEIEHCARNCIGNSMAAVILRREADGQNSLHLFVAGDGIDAKALMQRLENELPSYMRPGDIHVLKELPVNLNGKIDRLTLANMLNN
jgi:acyl-coenzyme A synthetase/AMP-(fatty) acid ligase